MVASFQSTIFPFIQILAVPEKAIRTPYLLRGAAPLGLPRTLSREPLRRLAPFPWLASLRSLATFFAISELSANREVGNAERKVKRLKMLAQGHGVNRGQTDNGFYGEGAARCYGVLQGATGWCLAQA